MKHPVSRELFGYWSRLRGSRSAPERSDVDPAAIRGALSDTMILEIDGGLAPRYPVRLSGTRMNALMLTELRGKPLMSVFQPGEQPGLRLLFAAVADDATPLVAGLIGGPRGHRPIALEMLILPLRHHGRTHARLLGSIAPVEAPSWLGLLPIEPMSVTSLRLIETGRSSALAAVESAPTPLSFRPPTRYGNLVVHQGGR